MFSPTLKKHRLYTGDISNHITVIGWDVDGNFVTVEVGFEGEAGPVYTYEFEVDPEEAREMDESKVVELVADYHHH